MYIELFYLFALAISIACSTEFKNKIDNKTCVKPACIDVASELQQTMDLTEQPCDNFYVFVCDGYNQKDNIPLGKNKMDHFIKLRETVDEQTKTMIEEATGDTSSKVYKLVRKLYDACSNTAAIERDGITFIKHYLHQFGEWPLLKQIGSNKNEKEVDWVTLITKLRQLGFGDYLVSFAANTDPRNATQRILTVSYPHLIIQSDWEEKDMAAYRNFLTNIAVALGANKDEIDKEFEESTTFELQLLNIQGQEQERGMLISELEFNYPGIPWLEFIKIIVKDDGDSITNDDAVLVKSPQFILNLIQLLKFTSIRTLSNYLISRAVTSMLPYSTNSLRNEDLALKKSLHGSTEYDPRWKECLHVVSGRLHVATSSLYVKKYFAEKNLNVAIEIANGLINEFRGLVTEARWMDSQTKTYAIQKLDKLDKYIGFPKELLDDSILDQYYDGLELEANNYLQLVKQIDLFNVNKHYELLLESQGDNRWSEQSHINTIEAFYNPRSNALIFPAGLLQEPFFNSERPYYINYGTLGLLIGHEIIHGFDNQGKLYDEDGWQDNWWTPRTESDYAKAIACVIDLDFYKNLPDMGLNVNHLNRIDEVIADIGGIKLAYLAYQKWLQDHNKPEPLLPGLNYTQNQLFWISAASIWCSKVNTKEGIINPGFLRVYEALTEQESFTKDFRCLAGSRMNPIQKRCAIW